MRHQLGFLSATFPVVLDPGLRVGERDAAPVESWHLPLTAHSRVLLTFGGTAALYQAALALRLSGTDRVLMPAYNCGHEVEPFLRAGAVIDFYRVNEHMGIDLDHLASRIDRNTRAILVTHYFGFPQPLRALRELCDMHGIALIEDCAHALFSEDDTGPLGLTGHMVVYSLRKTLPLPHGGALVCHDPRWSIATELKPPPLLSTLPKVLERYQKAWLLPRGRQPGIVDRAAFIATRLLVDASKTIRLLADVLGVTQLDPDNEALDFPLEALDWGVSPAVERSLYRHDGAAIAARRRLNYDLLLAHSHHFAGCRPALPELPTGACPLYFPVVADNSERYIHRFQQRGIACVQWWSTLHPAVPWREYSEALHLKEHLVAFPVHQDLTDAHMQRIVDGLVKT